MGVFQPGVFQKLVFQQDIPEFNLIASNCEQTDSCGTGVVSQSHVLIADNCTQTDICGSGVIGQTNFLTADHCTQEDSCTDGFIVENIGDSIDYSLLKLGSLKSNYSITSLSTH